MKGLFCRESLRFYKKLMCSVILASFISSSIVAPAGAQILPVLNSPVSLTPIYQPPILLGLKIHPENPLLFDFIVDQGQSQLSSEELKSETEKLVKYFLAALTIPDQDVWVNLSPYEKDRIIPDVLGQTTMGKTMLEQDYLLKQMAASLTNPETALGQQYWNQISTVIASHEGARQSSPSLSAPNVFIGDPLTPNPQLLVPNQLNKVWIMPDKAEVLESNGIVLVGEKRLKVMLAEDHQAVTKNTVIARSPQGDAAISKAEIASLPLVARNDTSTDQSLTPSPQPLITNTSSQIFRSTILPAIDKAVNESKDFADVRQIYNSVILAAWYKKALKESLLGKVYADQGKVAGVETDDKAMKQRIYEQYLAAFKKGAYNLIKEEVDAAGDLIPRKYFSGGIQNNTGEILKRRRAQPGELNEKLSASSGIHNATIQLGEPHAEADQLAAVSSSGVLTPKALSEMTTNFRWARVESAYAAVIGHYYTKTPRSPINIEQLKNELLYTSLYKEDTRINDFISLLATVKAAGHPEQARSIMLSEYDKYSDLFSYVSFYDGDNQKVIGSQRILVETILNSLTDEQLQGFVRESNKQYLKRLAASADGLKGGLLWDRLIKFAQKVIFESANTDTVTANEQKETPEISLAETSNQEVELEKERIEEAVLKVFAGLRNSNNNLEPYDDIALGVLNAVFYEMYLQLWNRESVESAMDELLDPTTLAGIKPRNLSTEEFKATLAKLDLANGIPGSTIKPLLIEALIPFAAASSAVDALNRAIADKQLFRVDGSNNIKSGDIDDKNQYEARLYRDSSNNDFTVFKLFSRETTLIGFAILEGNFVAASPKELMAKYQQSQAVASSTIDNLIEQMRLQAAKELRAANGLPKDASPRVVVEKILGDMSGSEDAEIGDMYEGLIDNASDVLLTAAFIAAQKQLDQETDNLMAAGQISRENALAEARKQFPIAAALVDLQEERIQEMADYYVEYEGRSKEDAEREARGSFARNQVGTVYQGNDLDGLLGEYNQFGKILEQWGQAQVRFYLNKNATGELLAVVSQDEKRAGIHLGLDGGLENTRHIVQEFIKRGRDNFVEHQPLENTFEAVVESIKNLTVWRMLGSFGDNSASSALGENYIASSGILSTAKMTFVTIATALSLTANAVTPQFIEAYQAQQISQGRSVTAQAAEQELNANLDEMINSYTKNNGKLVPDALNSPNLQRVLGSITKTTTFDDVRKLTAKALQSEKDQAKKAAFEQELGQWLYDVLFKSAVYDTAGANQVLQSQKTGKPILSQVKPGDWRNLIVKLSDGRKFVCQNASEVFVMLMSDLRGGDDGAYSVVEVLKNFKGELQKTVGGHVAVLYNPSSGLSRFFDLAQTNIQVTVYKDQKGNVVDKKTTALPVVHHEIVAKDKNGIIYTIGVAPDMSNLKGLQGATATELTYLIPARNELARLFEMAKALPGRFDSTTVLIARTKMFEIIKGALDLQARIQSNPVIGQDENIKVNLPNLVKLLSEDLKNIELVIASMVTTPNSSQENRNLISQAWNNYLSVKDQNVKAHQLFGQDKFSEAVKQFAAVVQESQKQLAGILTSPVANIKPGDTTVALTIEKNGKTTEQYLGSGLIISELLTMNLNALNNLIVARARLVQQSMKTSQASPYESRTVAAIGNNTQSASSALTLNSKGLVEVGKLPENKQAAVWIILKELIKFTPEAFFQIYPVVKIQNFFIAKNRTEKVTEQDLTAAFRFLGFRNQVLEKTTKADESWWTLERPRRFLDIVNVGVDQSAQSVQSAQEQTSGVPGDLKDVPREQRQDWINKFWEVLLTRNRSIPGMNELEATDDLKTTSFGDFIWFGMYDGTHRRRYELIIDKQQKPVAYGISYISSFQGDNFVQMTFNVFEDVQQERISKGQEEVDSKEILQQRMRILQGIRGINRFMVSDKQIEGSEAIRRAAVIFYLRYGFRFLNPVNSQRQQLIDRVLNNEQLEEHEIRDLALSGKMGYTLPAETVVSEEVELEATTASSAAVDAEFTKGGIDFDPTNMNLQIKRDGKGVPLPLPQQNLEQINIQGLFPIIINIVPINAQTLPIFLGQTPKEPAKEAELAASAAG